MWYIFFVKILLELSKLFCYVQPTIVNGHHVFWSVRQFVRPVVRPSVLRLLKVLVKVVLDEVEVQLTWNLVHMFPMIWSF